MILGARSAAGGPAVLGKAGKAGKITSAEVIEAGDDSAAVIEDEGLVPPRQYVADPLRRHGRAEASQGAQQGSQAEEHLRAGQK